MCISINPENYLLRWIDIERLLLAIPDILSNRSAHIISMYYGIGRPAMALEDIGKVVNLTRERVRHERDKALLELYSHKEISKYKDIFMNE